MKFLLAILMPLACSFNMPLCGQSNNQSNYLEVGDQAPMINAFKWIKGTPIETFKKGQVYVVEFGATWCIPCGKAIPRLTALQEKYKSNVSILGFFVMEVMDQGPAAKRLSYVKRVEDYVKNRGNTMGYTVAVDDTSRWMENNWLRASGPIGVPRTFVVDKNGMIAWIGNNPDLLDSVVSFVNSNEYDLQVMVKVAKRNRKTRYEDKKLLLLNGNGGLDSDFLYRSILVASKNDFDWGGPTPVQSYRQPSVEEGGTVEANIPFLGRVQVVNVNISELYYMAFGDTLDNSLSTRVYTTKEFLDTAKYPFKGSSYGKYWFEPIVEVHDTSHFRIRYHYSLKVPVEKGTAQYMQEVMRRDLKNYFGYEAIVEDRMMPYWKVVSTPETRRKLQTKTPGQKYMPEKLAGGWITYHNADRRDIMTYLNCALQQYSELNEIEGMPKGAPFLDEIDMPGEIDFSINKKEIDAIWYSHDWEAAKAFYKRLGLDIIKGKKLMKVVVIRDSK